MEKEEEHEINKLATIVQSMESMTNEERQRAMTYLSDRYGLYFNIKREMRKMFMLKIAELNKERRTKSSVIAIRKVIELFNI